jgi:hypothetical protein
VRPGAANFVNDVLRRPAWIADVVSAEGHKGI